MKQIILIIFLLSFHKHVIAQETGFLKFEFNVDSILVVFDRDQESARMVASGDSVEFVIGTHLIEAYPPFDFKSTTYRLIYKDSTRILKYDFDKNNITKATLDGNVLAERKLNANLILIVDHDSEVYSGNTLLGTEFIITNQPYRNIEIVIDNPDFGTKTMELELNPGVNVYEHYRRPSNALARSLSFIPGISQIYKKQTLKGAALGVANLSLLIATSSKTSEYSDVEQEFFSLRKRYNDAVDEEQAFILGNLTEEKRDQVVKLDNQRRILLGSTLLIYAFNIFDGFTSKPEGGYRNERPLRFYLTPENGTFGYLNKATIQINFGTE